MTHDVAEAYALSSHLVVLSNGRVVQEGSRERVFRRPASPEAARVLGVQNLLPGTVIGSGRGGTAVEVQGIRLNTSEGGLRSGTSVTVGVRPEEVRARPLGESDEAHDAGGIPATLTQASQRGNRQRLLMSLQGDQGPGPRLHVEMDLGPRWPEDAPPPREWVVMIPEDAVHLWPREE